MRSQMRSIGLIGAGLLIGIAATIQFDAFAYKDEKVESFPITELRQLADVFGLIKSEYVEFVPDKKLITSAMSGMVASLDPHSAYLGVKEYVALRENTQGSFAGIGIEIGMEEGYVKVISPIEDSPAWRVGIKAGDLITRLDNMPVKGMTLDQAMKHMRGEPNTKIKLTVARKNEDKPLIFKIVRQRIHTQSIKSKIIEPGYAWLRITQFQEPTVDEMVRKIRLILVQEPHLKGLVLDLRNDPGGLLPSAIGVAAAFLPKGVVVVSTNGQVASSKMTFTADSQFYGVTRLEDPLKNLPLVIKTLPMAVLINAGSASASEIVAGALQDHHRATIIGAPSFGKGSVQTVIPLLPDRKTALKLTTARYYTPSGRSIQAKGIAPDLLIDEYPEGDLLAGLRLREADLSRHLDSNKPGKIGANQPLSEKVDELEEEQRLIAFAKKRKPLEFGSQDDFQLAQALNHLKGLPVRLTKTSSHQPRNGS